MGDIKTGTSVYDTAGYEYYYYQKLDSGSHLVNKIIEVQTTNYSQDDFNSEFIEGEIIELREVYLSPPKAKLNDEILKLNEKKATRYKEAEALQREANRLSIEIANCKENLEAEIAKYPAYVNLLRYIKHPNRLFCLVGLGYGQVAIEQVDRATIIFNKPYATLELLSYQGEYEDERLFSGSRKVFLSKAEAEKELVNELQARHIEQASLKNILSIKEMFVTNNREIPQFILEAENRVVKKESEQKKSTIERYECEIVSTQKRLAKLKEG